MKRPFQIKVNYFKPSGKLYTGEKFTMEVEDCGPTGHPTCSMWRVVDHIRTLQKEKSLPGLQSGNWTGPILVDCEDGFPCLIQPDFIVQRYEE